MKSKTGDRIKQAMKKAGLKQVDVVNKAKSLEKDTGIKLSKTDLSQYVNGKVTPGQKKLYTLSKVLNVSEAWLLGYDVENERITDEERKDFNSEQDTIAAHFDKENLTEEEMEEVRQFIEIIKKRGK